MAISKGITFEALTGLLQNLRRQSQITLSARNVYMAQVGCQVRQQTLHVGAALVPGQQTMGRRAMTQIMKPRLVARSVMTQHVGLNAQPAKSILRSGACQASTGTSH